MEDVDDLEYLDRQIASAEDLISRQQQLVERLHGRGESITHAEKLLATLHKALQRFRDDREVRTKSSVLKPPH